MSEKGTQTAEETSAKKDKRGHEVTIIVNGQQKVVEDKELSFEDSLPRLRRQPAERRKLGIHDHLPQGPRAQARRFDGSG